ncbi:hypothetical protein FLP41_14375 [Paracoccus marcusii]|uniref:hypothetical protein n=1 Tax=Paracoccus marcusii TaxID=59779 RepID=UPI002ECFC78D|nr:hypothetical protein FLP41_14375 [Paracoccus marcusii]
MAVAEAARLAGADGAERYPSKKVAIGSSGGQPALWSFSDCSTIQREIALLAMASRSPRLRLAMGTQSSSGLEPSSDLQRRLARHVRLPFIRVIRPAASRRASGSSEGR